MRKGVTRLYGCKPRFIEGGGYGRCWGVGRGWVVGVGGGVVVRRM